MIDILKESEPVSCRICYNPDVSNRLLSVRFGSHSEALHFSLGLPEGVSCQDVALLVMFSLTTQLRWSPTFLCLTLFYFLLT